MLSGMTAVGIISGQWILSVLIVFVGYMIWQMRQIYFLERWLLGLDDGEQERLQGIWLYIKENIKRYQKSGRKRKRRISRLLQRFNATLELIPDAIVVTDNRWNIEWVNAASARLLGMTRRNIGASLQTMLPEAVDLYREHQQPSLQFEIFSPGSGTIELQVQITEFGHDQYLITAHDITELKKVESIRREFLANVSHELRTPLTVVHGYLEMMESEPDWPADYKEAVRASRRQTQRMQLLVSDLLMLTKLEMQDNPLNEEKVNVPRLLKTLIDDARQLSDVEAHDFRLQIDEDLMICGSEAELASAFGNLIFNAVRHTPAGTRITVSWLQKPDIIEFSVADKGPGIEASHLARLTERFYRVDKARSRDRGGTGLGLSIARHVVQRHGGEINIDSKIGEGTVFKILLPLQRRV